MDMETIEKRIARVENYMTKDKEAQAEYDVLLTLKETFERTSARTIEFTEEQLKIVKVIIAHY